MPPRTPKTCRVRGYRNTTTDPSGYCKSHKSEGWKQYKPGQSCHQRGYGSRGCPSCSPVLCGGGRNRTLTQILVGRCYSFLDYPDAIHVRAVSDVRYGCQADGSSRWGACHGAGASRKKASFCIFIGHHHLCILLIINGYLFFACRIECFLFDIERVFLKLFARCMFKALRRKYGS